VIDKYCFGRFELQPATRQLLADGQPVELGARAFDVLHALIERRERLVTKEELLDLAWPGIVVEENNLPVQVSSLRRILGSHAIVTIPGRGYQFALEATHAAAWSSQHTASPTNNLPNQITSFIGRERELAEVKQLLVQNRLVTLIGAGGIGKTRLGLQVAADSLERFPNGVWLVELASLSDPGLVPKTAATALGLKEQPGKPISQTLIEHLKDTVLLLLLDNCEHLLDGCAGLADTLVRQCPQVTILASSREALRTDGEQAYRVPSLSLPDPKQVHTPVSIAPFEAVQLFTDRALLARADFEVSNQSAPTLASICYRLDGIPLAIELAAARVRSLSVEEINRKLDERFRLLTGGSRTVLPRQQTLRSLIDWSYDLLNDSEKRLLQRLSVFAGGWTVDAAERVCAGEGVEERGELDLLTSLADKSLVLAEQSAGDYRYRLLETVRQYAQERLSESGVDQAVRDRHLGYYLARAEEAQAKLMGSEQTEWLQYLEDEHENLREALNWSLVVTGSGGGLRLCGALQRLWATHGHLSEGRGWCTRFLGTAEGKVRTPERAKALNTAGVLAQLQADYPVARTQHEESLAIRRELSDRSGIASSLNNLANVFTLQGDYSSARTLYEESLGIRRQLGDRSGIAVTLDNLGAVAHFQGDLVSARPLIEESLSIMRELGHRAGIADALNSLGTVVTEQGDYAGAWVLHEQSLLIRRELGDVEGTARSLEGLAEVVAALGSSLRAARIWGAAERIRAEVGLPLSPSRPDYHRRVTAARSTLGDDTAFERGWQEGRALTLEQAIGLALEEAVEQP
jgi:non-specific serine/threonine protein kinase